MAGSIHDAIVREVSAWSGVTASRHRFGGTEFRFGRRELGHVHPSTPDGRSGQAAALVDLPFPLLVRDELVAAGRAEPHHIHRDSGWVSVYITGAADVPRVLELFRMNYERPWAR